MLLRWLLWAAWRGPFNYPTHAVYCSRLQQAYPCEWWLWGGWRYIDSDLFWHGSLSMCPSLQTEKASFIPRTLPALINIDLLWCWKTIRDYRDSWVKGFNNLNFFLLNVKLSASKGFFNVLHGCKPWLSKDKYVTSNLKFSAAWLVWCTYIKKYYIMVSYSPLFKNNFLSSWSGKTISRMM